MGLLSIVQQIGKPDQTQAELEAAFQSGKLVLVAFYGKNCKYCKADQPLLEALDAEAADWLIVVRVDVGSTFGKQLAQQVGIRGVPAYFLMDSRSGDLIYKQEGPLKLDLMIGALEGGAE